MLRLLLLSIFGIVFLAGCTKRSGGTPIDWHSLALEGKSMTLVHPHKVQILQFGRDSSVVATIGNEGMQGPLASPLWFWGIQGNVLIISETPLGNKTRSVGAPRADESVIEFLTEPVVDGEHVSASRLSGERVTYKLNRI